MPRRSRQTNSEWPSFAYSLHGLAISTLSRATLSRNMKTPLELAQVRTTITATATTTPKRMATAQSGWPISQSQAVCGKWMNSLKLPSFPALAPPPPLEDSISPARKALKPTTNHLWMSNGLNRAVFIRFQARLSGSTY